MGPRTEIVNEEKKQALRLANEPQSVSETVYRQLFETIQEGILVIDAKTGLVTDVNPFLVDILGYSRKDFIGKPLWRFVPFRDIQKNKSAFQDLLRSGYIRYEHLPLETKGGRCIEVEFISSVYQVGRKRMIQCNIRDNSQRMKAEKIRVTFETRLKQTQKMTAIATLAGGIAHVFNNALTVIISGLDVIEQNGYDPKTDHYFPLMKKAADKMSRLTQELLAYAKGGKYSIEMFTLSNLVVDSLPLIKTALKPAINIETKLDSDLPQVYADRNQIQMVLLAIVANASEAIEEKGQIQIICRKKVITDKNVTGFQGRIPGIYVCLTVSDNGRGMTAETKRRVFEPFFTTHFPGRGLGMAAVYGIVKNHFGWITIESQESQGTEVSVYLPAVQSTVEKSISSRPPLRNARKAASCRS